MVNKMASVPNKKVLVLGVSGATCSGKTTIAQELAKTLSDSKLFCQDDYYFPIDYPGHKWIPELNHINWDIVGSLDMHRMTEEIQQHIALSSSTGITNSSDAHHQPIIRFRTEKQANLHRINNSPCHIVIAEGFCILNHKPIAELCNLKYYFTLDYDECFRRRLKRVYEPPDCPGYFEKCVWPEHLSQLAEVKREYGQNVVYFDGNSINPLEEILRDIVKIL